MSYIQELVKKLSAPVPFKWRVQNANKDTTKVQCTVYIDARQVMEILDEHCDHGWSSSYEEIGGGIFCSICIKGPDGDIWHRSDAGNRVEDKESDQMYDQGFKATASDAFKRAAVQFGIGRFLYDQPKIWLPCNQKKQPLDEAGNVIWDLTEYMKGEGASLLNKTNKVTPEPKKSTPKPATQSAPPVKPAEPKPATDATADSQDLIPMTQKIQDAMIKAITDGKADEVKAAMPKYKMTLAQRTVLNALLTKK